MKNDIIQQIATAIASAGNPAFRGHAGATLDRLSKLAAAGELRAVSLAVHAHALRHPRDREVLIEILPVKIVCQYFPIARGLSERAISRWRKATRGWEQAIKAAARDPDRLTMLAESMADAAACYR